MKPPEPVNLKQMMNRDTIWALLTTLTKRLPMLAGWNSIVTEDELPIQTVCFLQNISLPTTRLDVVVETMKMAQKVASEYNETYAVVTYMILQ